MQCTQCGLANPPGSSVCTQCSTPLPLDDLTIQDSFPDSESSPDVDQTLTHSWSDPAEPVHGAASAMRVKPGRMLGNRYQILELLGEGGMGAVYKARDRELDRLVALKLIRPNLALSSEILHRFKQELILARQVTHRNVIRIFDLGEADGVKFITMEHIDGETLRTILVREGKLSPLEACKIIRQVCRGLEAAHAEGVIHRDLKPGNIMRDAQDRIVVMDFGVAHLAEAAEARPARPGGKHAPAIQVQSEYSQTGVLVGTPAYMAPEQALGQETDARSDVFAVGIIFFELLTGQLPFKVNSPEMLLQRTREKAKSVHEIDPKVPRSVSKIVERCLEPQRDLRYQSATQVLDHLDAWMAPPWRKAMKWSAAAAAVLLLVGTQILVQRHKTVPQHPPVSVLVSDFKNDTGDSLFEGTLEPAFGTALEGASFISSYNRAEAHRVAAQLQPGATTLDEPLARLVATREGIQNVVTGSIRKQGDRYEVQVRTVDPYTGKVLVSSDSKAEKKDVLVVVAKLAARVRTALGDSVPESVQLAQAETFTTRSLEAAHEYARAMNLEIAGKYEDAIKAFKHTIELDPGMGRAYEGIGGLLTNLGQQEEGEKYFKQALARIDDMSEREKYRTRGVYYLASRNTEKGLEELTKLVQLYPADEAGLWDLALAYFYRRDMSRALAEASRAMAIYPKNIPERNNLGLYAMYAGDFDSAIKEQRTVLSMNNTFLLGYVGLALSHLGKGRPTDAIETYRQLQGVDARGASFGAMGLADVALYEGRVADAIAILEKSVAVDIRNKFAEGAGRKLTTLAEAYLLAGRPERALAATSQALQISKGDGVRFGAARTYMQAGQPQKALALADELGQSLQTDPQAYAKLIQGEVELGRGKPRDALRFFAEAKKLADTWMGRFDLGRAYVALEAFAEAGSELETCLKRRGEATALFLDEVPTYHVFPPVYYYLGRAQEGLKSPAAAESYKTFLGLKQNADRDPLAADARRRIQSR
jgi:serine/threonine protein kinase/tetratricopeptide (TPR) repeat protein